MQLKILLPSHILVDEPVQKVIADGLDGSFCIKPKHIDFVSALKPGLLQFINQTGEEIFIALDRGILVKCSDELMISTYNAVQGKDLSTLKDTVEKRFRQLNESERIARSALAKLESGVVKRFIQR